MKNIQSLLNSALTQNDISVSLPVENQLISYLQLIKRWNRVFNLTAITNIQEMIYLHLIDSLMVAEFCVGKNCLDIGSGAGLPGIPLAILHPEQQWTLMDKNSKKTRFLVQVVAELKLKNVKVVNGRCENWFPNCQFENILSRAFGSLTLFTQTSTHLLAEQGSWIAMKGKCPEDELDDLPKNIAVSSIVRLNMQGMQLERHLITLKEKRN